VPKLQRREDELDSSQEPERGEREKRSRRTEVVELAAREEAHARLQPEEILLEAELLRERDVVDVAREEVVVVPLERRSADVHDAHQAARLGELLEDRDGHARPEQAVRRDEAGKTAADHGDAGRSGSVHGRECKPGTHSAGSSPVLP
jgi:hypothetical protein